MRPQRSHATLSSARGQGKEPVEQAPPLSSLYPGLLSDIGALPPPSELSKWSRSRFGLASGGAAGAGAGRE
eukprot:4752228-Pyramimonas_sp.AAC.1